MELPQYTLYLSLPRILIPKALILMCLGGFLYLGVWLNLLILNIIIPAEYHMYIILGIGVLVVMQGILNYLKFSNYRYLFYRDRVIYEGKNEKAIMLSDIQNIGFGKNFVDNIFNTGTITLSPAHKMRYVANTNQVYFYLQKLVQYAQSPYRQAYDNGMAQEYYQRQVR